jgi:Trp operon repressor
MIASDAGVGRRVGRPSVSIKAEQVGQLKHQDMSWRRIAKKLGIGTATACDCSNRLMDRGPILKRCVPKLRSRSSSGS